MMSNGDYIRSLDDYELAKILRHNGGRCNMCDFTPPDCDGECLEGVYLYLQNKKQEVKKND